MHPLEIGLVYELFGCYPPRPEDPPDAEVEYEAEATLLALEGALGRLGHRPVRLGSPLDLLARASGSALARLDAALSIAEGRGSRNREAWAPVLLEMLEIQQLGSDGLTLSLTLDKAWTQAVVAAAGVPVAPHVLLRDAAQAESAELPGPFPLFVKPRWEGTAKGIHPGSRVTSRRELAREVTRTQELYAQPALVEPLLEGAEYTVTLVGNDPPRVLPVLQRAIEARTRIGVHALERHAPAAAAWEARLPGRLEPALEKQLGVLATRAFEALECRDFARADFKLDRAGRVHFLEMNPLPSFAPDGSFGVLAELLGQPLEDLLAEVLEGGLRRLGLA